MLTPSSPTVSEHVRGTVPHELWGRVVEGMKREIGAEAVDRWLSEVSLVAVNHDLAVLSAPTRFLADWVERSFGEQLLRAFAPHMPAIRRVTVESASERSPACAATNGTPVLRSGIETPEWRTGIVTGLSGATATRAAPLHPTGGASGIEPLEGAPLDPRSTFDSFVVGKSNEMAHAAARRVAETADATFNPVFLHGGVGLGKTHLMHAIAWHLRSTRPGCRVVYLSAEQFMYRFVQAMRSRETIAFKQQFRSVDVLMVDDVQFIAGKDSTQEEFFHTFNALVDQNKQIVLSADNSPDRIEGLEERIRSRLQWGLVVDIHPADYELRLGILQAKAEQALAAHPGVTLDPKVLELLAQRISSNVRVLEGALTRLFAYASYTSRPVDLELTRECLVDLLRTAERKVTIDEIKRRVADHYNLRLSDLISARRARNVARPRQVAMYLAKTLTTKSLPEIGRGFGGRDHTTVLHAVRKIEDLVKADLQLSEDVEILRRTLEA
ncbi:MAG: chromosomal replication initiator protein DnaA [Pseudomonadota bacterium]